MASKEAKIFATVNMAIVGSETPDKTTVSVSPGWTTVEELTGAPNVLSTETITGGNESIFIAIGGTVMPGPIGPPGGAINCTVWAPYPRPLGTTACSWPFTYDI